MAAALHVAGCSRGVLGQDPAELGARELGLANHDLEHESLAEPPPSAMEYDLGRADGQAECSSDFCRPEAEVGYEGDCCGIALGKPGHATFDAKREVGDLSRVRGAGTGIGQVESVRFVKDRNSLARPEVVGGEVACDRGEPRAEA